MDRADYAAWHDIKPMRKLLDKLSPDRFFVEGRGSRIRDAGGRWYLDARSSLWNVTLGYDNARVVDAMTAQLRTLPFTNAIRYERPSALVPQYAATLRERLPGFRFRFGHSGSQMTEASVLLSRFLRRLADETDRDLVLALEESYHGTGAGAGALSGEPFFHVACGPVLPAVRHVPGPPSLRGRAPEDVAADGLEAIAAVLEEVSPERVTAILVEPVLGSRALPFPREYLTGLRDLCTRHGIHLILDEVTTGWGRVGAYTRAQQLGVEADLVVLGKGLAAGYTPLAALAVADELFDQAFDPENGWPFPVGSTTDGHPLAMAAGLAVLDVLEQDGVLAGVGERGAALEEELRRLADESPYVTDVRGVGLLWAVTAPAGGVPPGAAEPGGGTRWPRGAPADADRRRTPAAHRPPLVRAGAA